MKFLPKRLLILIQFIASAVFVVFVITSQLLPLLYIIILIIVLLLLLKLTSVLMKPNQVVSGPKHARHARIQKNGKKQVIGKILSLAISVVMIVACFYVHTGVSTLTYLTSSDNTIVTRYNVYVLKSKNISSISDLEGQTIANAGEYDTTDFNKATTALKKKISYQAKSYTSYREMVSDFYNGRVSAILLNGYYTRMMTKYYSTWSNDTSSLWHTDMHETASTSAAAKDFSKDTFTIYITGVDSRGGVTKTSRSDSNMILTVSPSTGQILMTSIPRDYYVDMAMAKGAKDKLTHAALFGTMNSLRTVENLMNLSIDFYCRVNFQALVKLVDAVDGIRVYSDKAFTPWTNKKVKIKKGWQTMDGKTALAFARERKTYSQGDRHRAANQQAVLKALIKKMTSTKILTNFSSIMSSISGLFQTDVSTDQIRQLINFQLSSGTSWTYLSSVLEGTSERRTGGLLMPNSSIWYMIPSQSSINQNAAYITNMIAGKKITVSKDSTLASEQDES